MLTAPGARATPAQGYAFTLSPVAHQAANLSTAWLLAHAVERSDPNTATATAVLASMTRERAWWIVFDGRGGVRCSVAASASDPAPAPMQADARQRLLKKVREGCAGRFAPAATTWLETEPAPAPGLRWSARQVCVGDRCVASSAVQHTLRNIRSIALNVSSGSDGAVAATARCVGGRWLIVSNVEASDGSDRVEGARFRGLPPAVRSDIVGYETTQIDGVVPLPSGLSCP